MNKAHKFIFFFSHFILAIVLAFTMTRPLAQNDVGQAPVVARSLYLLMDRNKDRIIDLPTANTVFSYATSLDNPKQESPYIHWINKDYDALNYNGLTLDNIVHDTEVGAAAIEGPEDLKDFAALAIAIQPYEATTLGTENFRMKIRTNRLYINLFARGWTGNSAVLANYTTMDLLVSMGPSSSYIDITEEARTYTTVNGNLGLMRLAFEIDDATNQVTCIENPDQCFIEVALEDSAGTVVATQKGFVNFLPVKMSYKLPHEELPATDADRYSAAGFDDEASQQLHEPTFRILAGASLGFEYNFPSGATGTSVIWTFPNAGEFVGELCTDFDPASCSEICGDFDQTSCSGGNNTLADKVYWHPTDWTIGANNAENTATVELEVRYSLNGRLVCNPCEQKFKLKKRELAPITANNKPMRGDDVAMLERMLWQLGNTASFATNTYRNYGYLSRRIPVGERDTFNPECPSAFSACRDSPVVVTEDNRYRATMARLVWGFKNANEIEGRYDDAARNDFTPRDNIVTDIFLGILEAQWDDYFEAYTAFDDSPTITHDHTVDNVNVYNDDNAETNDDWASHAVQQWNNTFNADRLQNLRELTGVNNLTREMLIEGWARKESAQGHWGRGVNDYRITAGAADSKMSLGFSQVQSRYIYGTESTLCDEVRALNMMHPRDNLAGFVVWTAYNNCGESFHQAFGANRPYDEAYDNTAAIQLLRAEYGENQQNLLLQADNTVLNFDETNYERLTKGIAGYNQGMGPNYLTTESLPFSLRVLNQINYQGRSEIDKCNNYPENSNNRRRCIGYLYAVDVKERAGIPLARYQWRTQINGEDLCFWYGEAEWEERTWTAQRELAVQNDNTDCPEPANPE